MIIKFFFFLVSLPAFIFAYSHAPTFLVSSQIDAKANQAASINDKNLVLHKAVADSFWGSEISGQPVLAHGTMAPTPSMKNAVDGNEATCLENNGTRGESWVEFDLGSTYVIDSTHIKWNTSAQDLQYDMAVGFPYNPNLKPTYDTVSGFGVIPGSLPKVGESDFRKTNSDRGFGGPLPIISFQGVMWVNGAQQPDSRKIPPVPARFLKFQFKPINSQSWAQLNPCEVQVFGHPYVATAGDEVLLPNTAWEGSAYAAAASDFGSSLRQAFDGGLANKYVSGKKVDVGSWYQIDMGDTATFNKLFILFAIGSDVKLSNFWNLFATADTTNWGNPITTIDYKDSVTATFPIQHGKRFFKLVATQALADYLAIDELLLYKPYDPNAVSAINISKNISDRKSPVNELIAINKKVTVYLEQALSGIVKSTIYDLTGKRIEEIQENLNTPSRSLILNVEALKRGTYFAEINVGKIHYRKSLLIVE